MDIKIFQINLDTEEGQKKAFMPFRKAEKINAEIYEKVFEGTVEADNLEDIYRIFNIAHPDGYKGRSLSVSDVVGIKASEGWLYSYCDIFGYKPISFTPKS